MLLPDLRLRDAGRVFQTKNTERFKWDEAKSVAAAWEAVGGWDGKFKLPPSVVASAPALQAPGRMAIADACAVFVSLREGEKIAARQKPTSMLLLSSVRVESPRSFVSPDQLVARLQTPEESPVDS